MAYIDNVNKVLNIQPEAAPTRVRLSQNENGRNLYFTLAGNENPIPSGVTVTIIGTKPDGTVYSGTGSISNDVVLIPETVQLTAVAGVWDAKVKITSGGNTVATGRIRFLIDADTVAPGSVPSSSVLEGLVEQAQQYAETARQEAYGSPLTATTVAGMTDHTRVYVYTGSESGYTAGHWYYWNGSAWTDGGIYNSTAVQTDKNLRLSDVAADAKVVGDEITSLKGDLSDISSHIFDSVTKSGTFVVVDNASVPQVEISAETATLSIKHTGKNLLKFPYTASSIETHGLTFDVLTDGSVHVTGTGDQNVSFTLSPESSSSRASIKAGTYTLSGTPSNGGQGIGYVWLSGVGQGTIYDYGGGVTFTIT